MAGTPYELRAAYPGFGYAGGVQDILTAYNGLHHRTSQIRYNSFELLEEQVVYLQQLKIELERQEDEFFSMFNIQGQNKKESFKLLNNKIQNWNSTGAWCLINDASVGNQFYIGLQELKRYAIAAEITQNDWDTILNATFDTVNDEESIRKLIENGANIAVILNEILGKKTFSTGGRSSLIDNLQVTIGTDGKIEVRSNKNNITPSMQLKITNLLKKHLEDKAKKSKPNYNFKQAFEDLFNKLPISAEGQRYIRMALGDLGSVLDRYAFSSNDSQIKGFLGEVYNNAFLYFMADGSSNKKDALSRITPTGTILNTKGQELVIDTWLRGIGIQVKNYEVNKIANKGFNVHDSYDAYYFVRDVLQLDGSANSVGDILLNFFTSFDYNQRYEGLTQEQLSSDAYKYFVSTRARMHDQMENTNYLTQTFMPYITKILKIDQRFASEDALFGNMDIYHNTFFNISGKYVPSSAVVQAIIDSIQKNSSSDSMTDLIRARFSTKHNLSSEEKWNPSITDTDVNRIYNNRKNYAAATKINYSITLDISRLVENILL